MDQTVEDRARVQGGLDSMKETLDQLLQEKMNLKGQVYVLSAKVAELMKEIEDLTPKKAAKVSEK